jgi:hypothetical protein
MRYKGLMSFYKGQIFFLSKWLMRYLCDSSLQTNSQKISKHQTESSMQKKHSETEKGFEVSWRENQILQKIHECQHEQRLW